MMLYSSDHIDDSDLPHRTKVTQLIRELYNIAMRCIATEIEAAPGRVSFTSDLWSDHQQHGFMAITLHFCAKDQWRHLVIRSCLGAFRNVWGSHDGPTLAAHFIEVLEELGLLYKVCRFRAITQTSGTHHSLTSRLPYAV
ncbi:hypothetical protein C8Q72DRAFT_776173 [Fomitopsis betulina]|nr:hypothetical protein C8Q72DRAFT_776173 [Fomitopsis betulina]